MVSNKQSKFIKSLKIKKYRSRENCFMIEGAKNVLEAIHSGYKLVHLLATTDFIENNLLPDNIVNSILIEVEAEALTSLGTFKTNNECLAVAEMRSNTLNDLNPMDSVIALEGINDPGNLGTIIRTMDWFGMSQLVCSQDTTDFYSPKVINSTMGSFSRVKVVYTDLVDYLKERSTIAVGADLEGLKLSEWKPSKPVILVMGSESHGISKKLQLYLDSKVSITGYGKAESLNVAIATGILCHHLRTAATF